MKFRISTLLLSLVIVLLYPYSPTTEAVKHQHQQKQKTNPNQQQQHPEMRHCDMGFCGPVVTLCTKNLKCSCDLNQVKCAKACLDCLGNKFGKCCPCVHLCPPLKEDIHSSHVGDIAQTGYEDLFETLTEADDIYGRWTIANGSSLKEFYLPEVGHMNLTVDEHSKQLMVKPPPSPQALSLAGYDQDLNLDQGYSLHQDEDGFQHNNNELANGSDNWTQQSQQPRDCVVAFINKPLSMSQCKRYCRSMGASSFRWFHDEGCCECVGKFCIHYGIAKPKCNIKYDI